MAQLQHAPSVPPRDSLLFTKSGKLKSRFTDDEKLQLLDPAADRNDSYRRLEAFQKLFAFRFTNAIVTRVGQGPRAWTALRGPLELLHIVRHLLANHIPTKAPCWFGARSFTQSRFFCLDVDAERTPEQALADEHDVSAMPGDIKDLLLSQQKPIAPKPPLAERRQQVELAFERMGIDHKNPNEVLLQRTPSGGFHYYVFFDNLYFIDQYRQLLTEAGLAHAPGEIEFFPSDKQGLRLPFGYIPGREHDPRAWIRFIDKYRSGRIRRHSLETLCENLEASCSRPLPARPHSQAPRTLTDKSKRRSPILGAPKADRADAKSYLELLTSDVTSPDIPKRLLQMGIQATGTRNRVLNILAAHLIWFQHKSAEEAVDFLTEWALDSRHDSVDIDYDLVHGTHRVQKQIQTMCCWYEKNKQPDPTNEQSASYGRQGFTANEILALGESLADVPPSDRAGQAEFLLHFLRFARRHGTPTVDNKAWVASPAIRPVVRRWPGCHHMNYKSRIDRAIESGILVIVKEKWHSPKGRGRARTYRLPVYYVHKHAYINGSDWIDYVRSTGRSSKSQDG